MSSLAFIHYEDEISIPRPLCARTGDVFEAIVFPDDPPTHALPGAIAIVQLNLERHKWLHAIRYQGSLYLARLYFGEKSLKVSVQSLHRTLPSGNFPRKALDIIGCVVELYPTGDLDVRAIYYQDGLTFQPLCDLPFFSKSFSKNNG